MSALKIGSLCSGFGGLDQSVMDVLDAEVAWHAQYDPDDKHQYAAKILAHHWPEVPNHGDITAIDWTQVEPVDILTAGFPCQPVSNAGKRKGHEDDRWLWPDVASAIRVLRPRLVLLENVAALVGRGLDRVLASLAALGFDAEWTCLRASEVGGHTAASGSSSLRGLLPTPRTSDTNGAGKHGSGGPDLRTVVSLLPTPTAADSERASDTYVRGNPTLKGAMVRLLPTPTVQAHSRNSTANRTDPKPTTNTKSSTLLDVFWAGAPTPPPLPVGSE